MILFSVLNFISRVRHFCLYVPILCISPPPNYTHTASCATQVMQLLPVCESAARVREFLRYQSRYEFGLVSHAMCAAVRAVVRQFDVLVAQLEHLFLAQQQQEQQLSLQKLAYLLQPSRATLRVLERLCVRVRDCVGGQLLDRLHGCLLEQGDARSRDLHVHLLHKAAEPFLHALSQWIFRCLRSRWLLLRGQIESNSEFDSAMNGYETVYSRAL